MDIGKHTAVTVGELKINDSQLLERLGITQEQADVFWSCMDHPGPDECWLWKRTIPTAGYGLIRLNGKQFAAHRLAWMLHHGRVLPPLVHVCHGCDNRHCSNPTHLFIGTAAENQQDCVAKGRKPRGKSHGMSVVSEVDIPKIRALYDARKSATSIGREFGLNHTTVHQIGKRRTWRHVLESNGTVPVPTPKSVRCEYHRRGSVRILIIPNTVPFLPLFGNPEIVLSQRQIDRFWSKVKKSGDDECWPWQGYAEQTNAARGGPYGRVGFGYRLFMAHRVAWFLHYRREIGEDKVLCHRCDYGLCCNPLHLYPGSSSHNSVDAFEKDRRGKGEKHPSAKLDDECVRRIRVMRAEGKTLAEIARIFNVGTTIIHRVVTGQAWQHVQDAQE